MVINYFDNENEIEDADYKIGKYYYLKNYDNKALYWLNRSMKNGNLKSLELIQEINTKRYILKNALKEKRKRQCQASRTNQFI